MARSAAVYRVNGKLIVAPIIRTTTGLGLEVDPEVIDLEFGPNALADSIKKALLASDRVVPHPAQDRWKGFFEPFQNAAGVRSYKAFMKDAECVSVRTTNDGLKLTPQRNLGSKAGFEPVSDKVVMLEAEDYGAAATTVLAMIGISAG